ncbi:MAG TPA: nitrilase-related carbon-nitrogen hydrolase [Gammaproteobacteria bacterium]|nr:nitrilase-related carbon-nitrogen hydrolase [Gammaproteobacteria bacterium]
MTAFVLMLSWCLIYRQKMLVLILLTLGMISISFSHQYTTPNDTITASILQGPLAKNSDSIKIYENLTTKSGSDIIIWPEVTLDGNSYLKESTVLEWNTYLINKNQSLFAGTRFKDNNQNYYNAAIALGKAQGHYFKHFLVPFGEFIPLIQYFPHSLDYFNLRNFGLGGYSFSPHKTNPFNIDSKVLFNSFICYEMAYPRLNKYINRSAQANIVFNNEYWYEGNLQRTHMINFARLMSIQTQKPTLVSSIAGPTVSIDHQGVIIGKLDKHQIGSLETNVELYSGNTPYELYSLDKWFIISMLITFIGMIVYEYKTRRNS